MLRQLADWMQPGDLLVMEDGVLDDLGLSERDGGGPNRALREFFSEHPDCFRVDRDLCDLFDRNANYAPNG
ncbi:cephalosporin hydroxylase [Thiorhodovibrio frisius]|uniref:Cephalosporin hydroxylase n=1 Tax=Thiorhodovibrio frisius TaxID=631362 RepID=H8YVU8_9GAMM|nr:cephalosporin hydroxylase [Thiorhodovibrio frisius]EIC23739.1 cephalosporin hydroxylase [Thiorhodovibrio frisius]